MLRAGGATSSAADAHACYLRHVYPSSSAEPLPDAHRLVRSLRVLYSRVAEACGLDVADKLWKPRCRAGQREMPPG